jgi:hypothetical protein
MPVSVSFTVETDGRLPSGERLRDAIEAVDADTPPDYFAPPSASESLPGVPCRRRILDTPDPQYSRQRIVVQPRRAGCGN